MSVSSDSPLNSPTLDSALRTQIVERAKAGQLIELIDDRFEQKTYNEFKQISAACADIHNSGEIDLISLVTDEILANIDTHQFFNLQHFYLEAIPRLQIPLTEMLALVDALVRRAGEDLTANRPNSALLTWLQLDQNRAKRLLQLAADGDEIAIKHITFALQALRDVERAQALVQRETGAPRLSGLTALARLEHSATQAETTRDIVSSLLAGTSDDATCAHALAALFGALSSATNAEIDASKTLAVMREVGPNTQYQCAQALSLYAKRLEQDTRARLFDALRLIPPEFKGTLRIFDQALSATFGVAPDEAIAVCKRFLIDPSNEHELAELPSLSDDLLGSHMFGATVLSWLASGEYTLCEGLHKLLQRRERASEPLQLPTDPPYDDESALFISKKAIGYFFTQPVIAASILVNFLRRPQEGIMDVLEELLVDPLLSNYGGELRDYLMTIGADDAAYGPVASALKRVEAHLEQLAAIGRIAELRPSATDRQIERVRHADQMRASFKEARKESVFHNLVSRSVVLHGRRTTSYRRLADEPLQRFDMDLGSHGVSFELPRLEAADPLGLDLLILTYRSMRRTKG